MEDKIKDYFPGWMVTRKLGQGSFGAVFEIAMNQCGLMKRAAVKIISIPQHRSDIDVLLSDGYDAASIAQRYCSFKDDIVQEYSTMSLFRGCPNVVHSYDHAEIPHEDGFGWDILIMMELLTPIPKCIGPIVGEADVIHLAKDITNALIECRNRGVIHRDIKPQNIFVTDDGVYKLGDFGIAKTVERTTAGTKIGTYGYMAPEIYFSKPYGCAADIYSLGLVLYWMMNEHRGPFLPLPPRAPTSSQEEKARRIRLDGEPLPPPAHGSEELKNIILRACAWDPAQRFQTAQEMHDALIALENGYYIPVPLIQEAPPEQKSKEVNLLAIGLAALSAIGLLVLGGFLFF